ncbi:hypothetical protein [Nostoc punctiforme]|uniref:Uncharacterized protein n=2 Tax=Nostoc punctiforme TaxID=272131 RepID=B2ITA6_NOSP7|nr:hypothetical protein [Nostoc punctiforme]ACC81137.1 hypothetical protein Npun_R2583 [Nostoc punctiforme PCC 73102]RCJ29184.1 hypothetical protein A6769_35915 [Nostoc punctiforme NIES-2108]
MPTDISFTPQITIKETTSIGVPLSPNRGDRHNEVDANNDLVMEWFWNGSLWLSRKLYQQSIHAWSGQGVLIGGVIGDISATTDNIPFNQGNDYDIYLYKIHGMFRVLSGNLSAANYWALQFRNTTSNLQSINITAGNGGETTDYICKSSNAINTKYSKLGAGFNTTFVKTALAPNIRAPIALIQYRLAR